ncbi:MAG: hypothetical protein AAGA23_19470 [Pseudomonadota bacterium]
MTQRLPFSKPLPLSLAVSGLLLCVAGPLSAKDYCEYRKSLDFTQDVGSLAELDLNAGPGSLRISGDAGASQIVVNATACASSEKLLDGLRIDQRTSGDKLMLDTVEPDRGWSSWSGNSYAGIELEIVVPASFDVSVEDTSGSATIEGVHEVYVEDGSGELTIRSTSGPVSVDDGSGSLTLRDIGGRIYLNDGSGSIDIDGAREDVFIEEDGSGGIDIRDVALDVVIEEDGSGGITVSQVGGDVLVDNDGSGGIKVADVTGSLTVRRDGNGGINYSNVAGDISVPEDRRKRKKM